MSIPCRNTSCKPKRWNANVLGTAPRRLTPPTASRKPHRLNLRQFIESRKTKDITFSDITGEFAESFKIFLKKELRRRNGHMNHCVCWPNRLIYIAVDRKVLWPNPIKDTAYEKKEAPKLKHISRSELEANDGNPDARPDDGAWRAGCSSSLADRSGLRGYEGSPSPSHRNNLGRKKIKENMRSKHDRQE